MTKLEQWKEFSKLVEDHIENYVVPQYGDYPDPMVEGWTEKSVKDMLDRYVARIGKHTRGVVESRRDAVKIAHYACYLLSKIDKIVIKEW